MGATRTKRDYQRSSRHLGRDALAATMRNVAAALREGDEDDQRAALRDLAADASVIVNRDPLWLPEETALMHRQRIRVEASARRVN